MWKIHFESPWISGCVVNETPPPTKNLESQLEIKKQKTENSYQIVHHDGTFN